jgi:hypothetical protein
MFILSTILSNISLQPGEKTNANSAKHSQDLLLVLPVFNQSILQILAQLYGIAVISIPLIIIILIVYKKWALLRQLSFHVFGFTTLIAGIIFFGQRIRLPEFSMITGKNLTTQSMPHTPDWIEHIGILASAFAIALFATFVLKKVTGQKTGNIDKESHSLSLEAQHALDSLQEGQDLQETILHCYLTMIHIVKESHGIIRDLSMTPLEFERHLELRGFEKESVSLLTRLFEKARYSDKLSDDNDYSQAVVCLEKIASLCRGNQ